MAGVLSVLKKKCYSEAAKYRTLQPLFQTSRQEKHSKKLTIMKCPTTIVSKRVSEISVSFIP